MNLLLIIIACLLAVIHSEASPTRRPRKSLNPSRAPISAASSSALPNTLVTEVKSSSAVTDLPPRRQSEPISPESTLRTESPTNAIRTPTISAGEASSIEKDDPLDGHDNSQEVEGITRSSIGKQQALEGELQETLSAEARRRFKGKALMQSLPTKLPSTPFRLRQGPSSGKEVNRPVPTPNDANDISAVPSEAVSAAKVGQRIAGLTIYQRRRLFKDAWKKLNIDWKNPPEPQKLVERVRKINILGVSTYTIGQMAAYQVRLNTPESYMEAYRTKSDRMNSTIGREVMRKKKRERKQGEERGGGVETSTREPGNSKRWFRKSGAVNDESTPLHPSNASRTRRTMKRYDEIVKALDEKNIWSLPPDQLEAATRDFPIGKHTPNYIRRVIGSHLQSIGRANDAKEVTRLRDLHRR